MYLKADPYIPLTDSSQRDNKNTWNNFHENSKLYRDEDIQEEDEKSLFFSFSAKKGQSTLYVRKGNFYDIIERKPHLNIVKWAFYKQYSWESLLLSWENIGFWNN